VRTGGLRGDGGTAHALRESELRGLRRLARDGAWYPQVFCTDGGVPLEGKDVVRMLTYAGTAAKLGFAVHPHMLRHACGLKRCADERNSWAVQYLGHRSVPGGAKFADSARRSGEFWTN
jgi:type 1 fimbriae regulatory protein FimB/type 1 fimbriae regulatory protein FimE